MSDIPTKGVSFEYLFEEQPCLVGHALQLKGPGSH